MLNLCLPQLQGENRIQMRKPTGNRNVKKPVTATSKRTQTKRNPEQTQNSKAKYNIPVYKNIHNIIR